MILADFSSWLGSVFFAAVCFCVGVGCGVYISKRGYVK
jgi:hypothetical protein